ncbi:CLUMA_CG001540, isoform A [Clunio marinus]|uniref:RNA helicase n=1 Tax=Clunio marinus TaxID=568069 RepID=A0A1J1HK52_9DIPT|nr:CLUMA_CG001540, isoform A [Clunio marinus]
MSGYESHVNERVLPRFNNVVDKDFIVFHKWKISTSKSHILKSICTNREQCKAEDKSCCELCVYRYALDLPHLPDMVFHKNILTLEHDNGAVLTFNPIEALKRVRNEKLDIKVSCSDEWQESRPRDKTKEKLKPFDWTFSTDYQGTPNDKFVIEPTDLKIDKFKLMAKEQILFYNDLTLFEDELHDNGTSVSSVKVRVMPSGFYILLRFFMRVDNVMIRMNETRYHYETGKDFIIKEYTSRESTYDRLRKVPPALFICPNEIGEHLPVTLIMGKKRFNEKGRQNVETIIDNSSTKKIKLDNAIQQNNDDYKSTIGDELLVLPSEKRATKVKKVQTVTRILSRKQRKRLEKIVEKKKKKENRSSLLEALANVQIPSAELKQLTSLTAVQTKGLKKHFHEQKYGIKDVKRSENIVDDDSKLTSTLKGSKRMSSDDDSSEDESKKKTRDYNVVGLQESSSDSEFESENVEEIEKKQKVVSEESIPELKPVEEVQELTATDSIERKPAKYVHVDRDPEIQAARLKLPIIVEEQVIMETISGNMVTILAGETGSGKTTQVPQFLYEAGYASEGKMIGITEPRRVAAIAMSQRVGREMNLSTNIVSYLIRFEGNCTDETKIKFMTDGVLLKEVECDFLLQKYSVIILDEAHERSAYTDILIGLLSRIIQLRAKQNDPLKLIIMSATLRVEDFTKNTKLFKEPPPVIKVDARQFPVTVHFNKTTAQDYVREALLKIIKVHTKLPDGGILVFVTGQQEVRHLVKKLRNLFPYSKRSERKNEENEGIKENDDKFDYSSDEELENILNVRKAIKHQKKNKKNFVTQMNLPKIKLDDFQMPGDDTEVDFNQDNLSEDEIDEVDEKLNEMMVESHSSQPLWVLPLYSLLPSNKQARVFETPPEGTRLCVIATNVAETSLTIPGIKYVIDSGRQKTKLYDKVTGVNAFVVTFSSKAAADQRAGRAGRVAPGHCYRLYSSAVYNDEFVGFSPPEIQEKPIDALSVQEVLQEVPLAGEQGEKDSKWRTKRKTWAGSGNSLMLGDPMILLKAVGAAEFSHSQGKLQEFCDENGLRLKAIKEIRKLRIQLTNDINLNVPKLELTVDPLMKPPNDQQSKMLRQILLSGLGDQVARKIPDEELKLKDQKHKLKYAYQIPDMEEPVHIHSCSILKKKTPEWIVYQEVYETRNGDDTKIFIRGITAIEPEWLLKFVSSLCNYGKALEEPEPRYDAENDKIYCHVKSTFGRSGWPLPIAEIEMPETLDKYRNFARFLLKGEVFPMLEDFTKNLLSSPSTMTKSWSKLMPRTEMIMNALANQQVDSKEKMIKELKLNKNFLLKQYLMWIPEALQFKVTTVWSELIN